MNRLGWLLFDVALAAHRYRRRGARRVRRDLAWETVIKNMGAWRAVATV